MAVLRSRLSYALAAVGLLIGMATGVLPTGVSAAPPDGMPDVVLDRPVRGAGAIQALGKHFPAAAIENGMQPDALRRLLNTDDSAWVGPSGNIFFVEELIEELAVRDDAAASAPVAALSDTFRLHSLPGAKRVIYLDFDGHEAAGSAWAQGRSDTYAEPYSQDGDTAFSDAELTLIQEVWARVAEDYAPFAVDVTTEDPGIDKIRRTTESDDSYGTRIAFSPNIIYDCGCGGVAYLNAFDTFGIRSDGVYSHDYLQPGWVVTNTTRSAKTLAEAASHEAGHNLSLFHDGTSTVGYYQGHGDWAPIMGVGYYRNVSQWSKGEYNDASNKEDDLSLIESSGAPLRADDHGDSIAGGTVLTSTSVNLNGFITTRSDRDYFVFTTTGGQLSVNAAVAADGPNLDVSIRVVDASGGEVASADPAGLAASVDTNLSSGTYAIVIDGVGAGSPGSTGYSDYGSLGAYSLSGKLPTLTDGGGGGGNTAPTAVANASVTSGQAPLAVTLTATGSNDPDGDPLSYSWNLGNGSTATGSSTTVTYETTGLYQVTLTVSDGKASASDSVSIDVFAGPVTPVPLSPSNVKASASGGTINVTWIDRSTNEDRFVVVRETLRGSGAVKGSTTVATLDANTTSFTDSVGRGTYQYKVYAANSGGESATATSNRVSVRNGKQQGNR